MSYQQSLSQLLKAEEDANRIIQEAEEKREKMKEHASKRAKDEISELRAQMQADFDSKKVDTTKEEAEIKEKTQQAIAQNEEDYNNNKEKVVDMLVERILHIGYELQRNVIGDFESLKNN